MALERCPKCGKTSWCGRESELCAICTVIEKSKKLPSSPGGQDARLEDWEVAVS